MHGLAKALIIIGVFLIVLGGVFLLAQKFPWIGRLPGDIYIKKGDISFHFPITTCLIISVILSLIMVFLGRR